jgi:hypothetical protein
MARAQGVYFYSQVTQQVSMAGATNVVTTPSATTIAFCNAPVSAVPCTNKATTYTDATLATACPSSTQIVLASTNSCVGFPDARSNWGVWASQGQYAYTVTMGGVNFGPYYITLTSDTVISPGVFTNTQMNLYLQAIINSCNPQTEYQAVQSAINATEAIVGCITGPAGATVSANHGLAGYATTHEAANFALGAYTQARCLANNTACWGINGVAQDVAGLTSGVTLVHEFDTQPLNAASAYADGGVQSDIYAFNHAGTYPMNAFSAVKGTASQGVWSTGFLCGAGSVGNACFDTGAKGIATASSNFNSNCLFITSNYWTGSEPASDQFCFNTSIGSGSPPTFVDLVLSHPLGISQALFLLNGVDFGMQHVLISPTLPTISSGFGTSPSIPHANGTGAFTIKVGGGGTATRGLIGLPPAANGWIVQCQDVTTQSSTVFVTKQTSMGTTSVTIGNFNTSGSAAAWAANDILVCTASGF